LIIVAFSESFSENTEDNVGSKFFSKKAFIWKKNKILKIHSHHFIICMC